MEATATEVKNKVGVHGFKVTFVPGLYLESEYF